MHTIKYVNEYLSYILITVNIILIIHHYEYNRECFLLNMFNF